MRTSILYAVFFTLFTTLLVSQGNTVCINVEQSDSGTKSIRLRGSDQTCDPFPLIVPKSGFQFTVYTPHKSTDTSLGSLRVYFEDFALPLSFTIDDTDVAVYTKSDTYLGNATLGVTTIEIQSDGTGFVTPRKDTTALLKLETTTTSAISTSTAQATSTATSNASWIVVGAVVDFVFVIVVIATVIGAVFIIRRIRRKRSATGLLATPTIRVTYPSNEIHRFNIPIDPKSKIADHGINFNDYLAVVSAYFEEIREFDDAEQEKKNQMYVGFLESIRAAGRTENKDSVVEAY